MIIEAHPRVHITLIDLAAATPRKYGGVGLVLDGPPIVTESYASNSGVGIVGQQLGRAEFEKLVSLFRDNVLPDTPGFTFKVKSAPPPHVGLGVGTALALSALVHASSWAGLELSPSELQQRSRRGGASGIGVHGFFTGGAIWDGGHPATVRGDWKPSAARQGAGAVPPLLVRVEIPREWRFTLMLPESGARTSGHEEADFFRASTPILASEALEVLALAYHGLLPAFRQRDLAPLHEVAAQICRTGFKKLEIDRHDPVVANLLACLLSRGVAAFMSSMGPLICAITDNDGESIAAVRDIGRSFGAHIVGTFAGCNRGYEYAGRQ